MCNRHAQVRPGISLVQRYPLFVPSVCITISAGYNERKTTLAHHKTHLQNAEAANLWHNSRLFLVGMSPML